MIRAFRNDDLADIELLWRRVFPDDPPRNQARHAIPQLIARDPDAVLVAVDEADRVIGTILSGYDGHRGWLYSVAVAPERRQQGIGAALVRAAEARLHALGCGKINLQVRGSNAAVARFYHALGYRVEERVSMGRLIES